MADKLPIPPRWVLPAEPLKAPTHRDQLKVDGLPENYIRPDETPEQTAARRRRMKNTAGPERKLKDPSKCKGDGARLGAPPAFLKTTGAKPTKQEDEMKKPSTKTKAKAAAKAKAKTPRDAAGKIARKKREPAKVVPPKAPRTTEGSKKQIIAEMLKRPEGCTTADVLKATGWPAVSMPQQAKAAGIKLVKEKVDGVTRYHAG